MTEKPSEATTQNANVHNMAKTTEESNKILVLEAFDTLFNKRGLQSGRAVLVIELYSTQRAHRAWARRPVQSG
jgi:hypothetical protein